MVWGGYDCEDATVADSGDFGERWFELFRRQEIQGVYQEGVFAGCGGEGGEGLRR